MQKSDLSKDLTRDTSTITATNTQLNITPKDSMCYASDNGSCDSYDGEEKKEASSISMSFVLKYLCNKFHFKT